MGHVQVEARWAREALEVDKGIVGHQQNGAVAGTEQARPCLHGCCVEHGPLVGCWAMRHTRVLPPGGINMDCGSEGMVLALCERKHPILPRVQDYAG